MTTPVLALDLEATLISNASSQIPRPGLLPFLEFCESHFERLLLFTCVEWDDARPILERLRKSGAIPASLPTRLEYVHWTGRYKDLAFIPDCEPQQARLVDDDGHWVQPGQEEFWIPVTPWYGDDPHDTDLARVQGLLAEWIKNSNRK